MGALLVEGFGFLIPVVEATSEVKLQMVALFIIFERWALALHDIPGLAGQRWPSCLRLQCAEDLRPLAVAQHIRQMRAQMDSKVEQRFNRTAVEVVMCSFSLQVLRL